MYVDWVHQGDSLWTTVLENSVPAALALSLPYAGWKFLRTGGSLHLGKAAKWALIGVVGTALLSGLIVGLQIVQDEIKPVVIVLQLSAVGAIAGLWVGRSIAGVEEARQATEDERDRLENLLDGLPAPVAHGRFEGDALTVLQVNRAFEAVFGVDAEGKNLYDLIVPDESREEAIALDRDALQSGVAENEVRRQAADGLRDFQVRVAEALNHGSSELYVVHTDITDQKRRERALREAREEAQSASRFKTVMLANMSHEIRTPLTSIQGFAEMLKETLDGKPGAFARRIHRGGQRLQRTLDSLLQVSMLEAGERELEREDVVLGEVVQAVVDDLRPWAAEQSLEVETDAPDAEVVVHWNEDALQRICRNLVGNAIKFTPEGGRVRVQVEATGAEVCLEVADTGIGMDPDAVERLFEAFRQESEGIDRDYEGVGLGLTVVKMLVDRLGGTIEVESEKGTGTSFEVWLPRGPGAEREAHRSVSGDGAVGATSGSDEKEP
jgi:PAS domain S-box-containing protein